MYCLYIKLSIYCYTFFSLTIDLQPLYIFLINSLYCLRIILFVYFFYFSLICVLFFAYLSFISLICVSYRLFLFHFAYIVSFRLFLFHFAYYYCLISLIFVSFRLFLQGQVFESKLLLFRLDLKKMDCWLIRIRVFCVSIWKIFLNKFTIF